MTKVCFKRVVVEAELCNYLRCFSSSMLKETCSGQSIPRSNLRVPQLFLVKVGKPSLACDHFHYKICARGLNCKVPRNSTSFHVCKCNILFNAKPLTSILQTMTSSWNLTCNPYSSLYSKLTVSIWLVSSLISLYPDCSHSLTFTLPLLTSLRQRLSETAPLLNTCSYPWCNVSVRITGSWCGRSMLWRYVAFNFLLSRWVWFILLFCNFKVYLACLIM